MIFTDPAHARRGAASKIVQWGCDRADQENLPVYLEASSRGLPLYLKFGFKELSRRVFDLTKYGGQGEEHNSAMFRPAPTSTS